MCRTPERQDHNFWWANTNFNVTSPFKVETKQDGFHFTGKLNYSGSSLINRHFGLISRYELQSNRIPPTNSGMWRSAPHVELFGSILGSTAGGWDPFGGDRWSKCWMHRRQMIYQNVFGPPGADNRVILAQNREVQELIFLEGHSKFKEFTLPGFQPLPQVTFNRSAIFPGISIWAETEIHFHVQLEGDSTLWIRDPRVLVRQFQWPLVPA